MSQSRRRFLTTSLATSSLLSLGAGTVPTFLARSARAARQAPASGDRILLVVQLLGGNDGLNTIVPHRHDEYLKARKALRLASSQVHRIDDEMGFHPGMGQMSRMLEDGKLAIVQGVGYPNPDRSHFRSMEIWETARTENGALETGWLGRVLDQHPGAPGQDVPALAVGRNRPLALKARTTEIPALETLEQFRLKLGDPDQRERLVADLNPSAGTDDPLLGFIRRSTLSAYESSQRLEEVAKSGSDDTSAYPETGLGRRLKLIAQVIRAGFGTRIYYTTVDGFDTHANQLNAHAGLLTEVSDALAAFHADIDEAGQGGRVASVVFSEFGRRVSENASAGTDHGAAAPVFLAGPVAKTGLIGAHPSLTDLDDGDLKFHTDFRCVYADLLENWLGMAAAPIVGGSFEPLGLLPKRS